MYPRSLTLTEWIYKPGVQDCKTWAVTSATHTHTHTHTQCNLVVRISSVLNWYGNESEDLRRLTHICVRYFNLCSRWITGKIVASCSDRRCKLWVSRQWIHRALSTKCDWYIELPPTSEYLSFIFPSLFPVDYSINTRVGFRRYYFLRKYYRFSESILI